MPQHTMTPPVNHFPTKSQEVPKNSHTLYKATGSVVRASSCHQYQRKG